jgi:hypothetical protein
MLRSLPRARPFGTGNFNKKHQLFVRSILDHWKLGEARVRVLADTLECVKRAKDKATSHSNPFSMPSFAFCSYT